MTEQQNGSFKMLLNTAMYAMPFLVALNVWFVTEIYALQQQIVSFSAIGPRYTPDMAKSDNLELKHDIMEEIETRYPPEWLRREVESHARRLEALEQNGHSTSLTVPYNWADNDLLLVREP